MMGIFALIKDDKVINTIVWDGDDIDFGEGVTPVEIPEGVTVSIGWGYADGSFSAPPLTEEQIEQQKQQAITVNLSLKAARMAQATAAIAPLQDAVDLDEATEEEKALLLAWKKYRIAVNRIDANTADDIDWPEQPE